jgi:hypothetical protein
LEEIEAVLKQHPEVQNAVIAAHGDAPDKKRLIAYVVPVQGAQPNVSELRRFLQQKQPDFMVPALFVMLDTLPLTRTGKVDRRSLPQPNDVRPDLEHPYVPPRTATEEKLAGIWREILGTEKVGVRDNFFDLGGHSLLLTQLAARVLDTFQVSLPLRVLFDQPTLEDMTVAILTRYVETTDRVKIEQMLKQIDELATDEILQLVATR